MPRFLDPIPLNPIENLEAYRKYMSGLRQWEVGRVELVGDDTKEGVKRNLKRAAREIGIKIRFIPSKGILIQFSVGDEKQAPEDEKSNTEAIRQSPSSVGHVDLSREQDIDIKTLVAGWETADAEKGVPIPLPEMRNF